VSGEAVKDMDVKLLSNGPQLEWEWKPIEDARMEMARQLYGEGVTKCRDLAHAMGISPSWASRLIKKINGETVRPVRKHVA
jgi:hypothetical protein